MPDEIERPLELRRERNDTDGAASTIDLGKDVHAIEIART